MTNIEHLVENGLSLLEENISYLEWRDMMFDDVNWSPEIGMTLSELWAICEYIRERDFYKENFVFTIRVYKDGRIECVQEDNK